MSRKRKNFHYHYAEQYETREMRHARSRDRRRFAVPPLALVFSIVLLAVFGLVSTTFSVYVTTSFDDPEMPAQGGLVVNVKNNASSDHPESTGIVRNNGEDLADSGADGNVTNQTVYYTPYHGNDGTGWIKDNVTTGAHYLYGDGYWQSANGSDTGRTQGGQRVYSVTVQEKYGGMDQLYFRRSNLADSGNNEQHAINGWSVTTNWSGKYYNGSSWVTYTADTYKVYNNGSALATLSFNSSTKKYTGSATLSAGTTYILNLYDGANYWANGGAGTLTATGSDTMYRYGSGGSGDGFSITPTVTGTYSFEWVLSAAGNREDTGTFKVTFPTTYTVTFNANGHGTAPASQTVVSGGKATEPTAPTASGYTFGGWYKESSCTNKWNFTSDTVTSNKTLYAKWTANQYCTMSVDASKSLTLGTATAVSFTTTNHSTGSVKITSGNSTYVQVCATQNGTYGTTATISNVSGSGTFYVKGLQPISTPVNLVVACNAGHSNAVSATCAVTVNTPTVTFDSLSVEELRSGTLSITGRTPAPTSYSWSVDSAYSSLISLSNQTATSVKVTAAAYSQATAKVKYTATYSTGYSKTFEATVSLTESTLSLRGSFDNWSEAGQKMTYDAAANTSYGTYTNRGSNLYSCTLTLAGGQTYSFGFNVGGTFYKKSTTITSDRSDCKIEVSNNNGLEFNTTDNDCQITTGAGGSYTFYFNPSNHRLWISEYPGLEYYLVGFGDWDEDEDTVMTKVSSTQYTFTKNFAAGTTYTYNTNNGFKIACNDGSWFGYNSTVTRTNTSVTMSTSANNAGLTTSYSGDYTFSFNPSTGALTVTYPTRSITVNAKLNTSDTILGSISNTSTSSDFFTITDNYDDTFTIAPKSHTQYQFTKWRDNNSTTGSRTITVSSPTAVTYDTNWNYKSYTITYNTNGGTLDSSCYDTVTTANSVYKSSYTYGTAKTLPTASQIHNSTAGYTFAGWYTNESLTAGPVTSISVGSTGEKTYYAKWEMEIEFRDNIRSATNDENLIETQTVQVGGHGQNPTLTSANAVLNALGFTFSTYSYDPTTTTFDAAWVALNRSNIIYVNYVPASRDFSVTITPSANVTVDTSGTYDHYTIPFGATIAAHAEVSVPSGYDEDIYIKWIATVNGVDYDLAYYGDYTDDDPPTYYDDENRKYVFERADIVTLLTKISPQGTYMLKAKAYYDTGSGTTVESAYTSHTITYQIDSPMSGVTKSPDQKIYSVGSEPDVIASITTHSSISQTYIDLLTDYYKVAALAYDKANSTTDKYDEIDGYEELEIEGNATPFTATFDGVSTGVNYYKFRLKRLEDIDDSTSDLVNDSVSTSSRTVVGTAQGAGTRPIYVANNSGSTFSGKRVMLFYATDRGTLGYATATAFNHGAVINSNSADNEVYRFDIPGYVESVSIGVFDSSKEYVLPEYSGSTLNYAETNFYTWSNWKPIESSTQKLNITGITANGQIADANITVGKLS
ncbi:MAG: InlB B-repeat-containing protein [Ruminococcus sp.]|nr:InlB B-repeat-containing protein [Ruminococcus sp.]